MPKVARVARSLWEGGKTVLVGYNDADELLVGCVVKTKSIAKWLGGRVTASDRKRVARAHEEQLAAQAPRPSGMGAIGNMTKNDVMWTQWLILLCLYRWDHGDYLREWPAPAELPNQYTDARWRQLEAMYACSYSIGAAASELDFPPGAVVERGVPRAS